MPAGTVPPLSCLPAMPKPRWGKPPATPRRGRWSTEEVARLRELYGHRTDASIGRELGRTAQAVRRTADTLFEGQELRTDSWTEADLELLRECLGASNHNATPPERLTLQPSALGACIPSSRNRPPT